MANYLDYIPVVGAVKNTVEAGRALVHGDYTLAASKCAEAAISGTLDALTCGTTGVIATTVAKQAGKAVTKGIARQAIKTAVGTAAGMAASCAVHYVKDKCRLPIPRGSSPNQSSSDQSSTDLSSFEQSCTDDESSDEKRKQKRKPRRRSISSTDLSNFEQSCTDDESSDEKRKRRRNSRRRSVSNTYSSGLDQSSTDADSSDEVYSTRKMYRTSRKKSSYRKGSDNDKRCSPFFQDGSETWSSQRRYEQNTSETKQNDDQNDRNGNDGDEKKRRPKRGYHVINNDVIKFYMKIIQKFVKECTNHGLQYSLLEEGGYISSGMTVFEDYHQPLPEELLIAIEQELVVSPGSILDDPNADIYGYFRQRLEEAVLEYMVAIHEAYRGNWDRQSILEKKRQAKETLMKIIEEIITGDIFVDQAALRIWLGEDDYNCFPSQTREKKNRWERFETLREAVQRMLRAIVDKAEVWVKQIIKAIESYYNDKSKRMI